MQIPRSLPLSMQARPPASTPGSELDVVDLVLSAGQWLDLSLCADSLLVSVEGGACLQPPSAAIDAAWRPPAQVLGDGEAVVCMQAGRWRVQALQPMRLRVHTRPPLTTRWGRQLQGWLRRHGTEVGQRKLA